jgi:Ethanolamine utilization protein EutJ (predicted chaperonin)
MVFAAVTQAETIETWYSVAEGFEFSALTLTATPLALVAGLSEQQGVLLDVGGTRTDLTWWQNGRPVALASLPRGADDLTRALLRRWRISADKAERLKRAFSAGRLDAEAGAQVLEALRPTLEIWLEETEAVLAGMDQDQPSPPQFYLSGGGGAMPVIAEAVRSLAWSPNLHFSRYPQVNRLQPTDVPGVVNRTELGREPGDVTALALAAWAAYQIQPPDRPGRILHELCE